MVSLPSSPPSRPTLRKLLGTLFTLEADFDAFVIDCFPWVRQRMSVGPDRIARVNLLFETVAPDELWAVLCRHYDEGLRSNPDLLQDDAKQSAAARQREVLHRELTQLQGMLDKCRELGVPTDKIEARMLDLRRKLRLGRQVGEQALLLNRYRLLEKLGEGGFATVWQARDCAAAAVGTELEVVAIKALLGHHHDNEAMLRRFHRGARLMRELEHPQIVRVLDGPHEDDELQFFVMEYLPGGDLRQGVQEKRLSDEQCITVILQVGDALHHAHSQGRVHRDVTPANILLDRTNKAKLCDFDLVLPRDSSTMAGRGVQGTLAFAPPEQLGRNIAEGSGGFDPKTDVYALGMTALYALTGREIPVVERAMLLPEEIARLRHGGPLKAVLRKALSWKPEARYETVAAFCEELSAAWNRRSEVIEVVEVAVEPQSTGPPQADASATMAQVPVLPGSSPPALVAPVAITVQASQAVSEISGPAQSAAWDPRLLFGRWRNWHWAAVIGASVFGALGIGPLILKRPKAVHVAADLGRTNAQPSAQAPVSMPPPSDLSVTQATPDLWEVAKAGGPPIAPATPPSPPAGMVKISAPSTLRMGSSKGDSDGKSIQERRHPKSSQEKPTAASKSSQSPTQLSMNQIQNILNGISIGECSGIDRMHTVRITVTIDPFGYVSSVEVPDIKSYFGESCIRQKIARAQFPRFLGHAMTVTLPLAIH